MAKETSKTPKGSKGDNRDKRSSKTNSTATTVTDFPRGGSNGLTPLEFREVTRQAEREAIFSDGVTSEKKDKKKRRSAENGESAKQTKSRKKKSKSAEKNSAADGDASDTDLLDDARLAKVENLTTKKLSKGALVLGCVSAIYELELSIALPNGVTGTVPITSISPEMTAFVEKAAGDAESDSEDADAMDVDASDKDDPLDLSTRFFVGQFVKCVVVE
ncbi:rRNA biogenesis protein rrp5, partial [Coemansia sp. RSA 1285]